MSAHGEQTTPAGWYPNGPGIERWWDGQAWGPQTRATQVAPMPSKAVTTQPRHTSHTFHLLMTVFTCGLWLPVWAIVAILNRLGRERSVTRYR